MSVVNAPAPPSSLSTLLESLGVGVLIWRMERDDNDASFVLEEVNAASSRQLGIDAGGLFGMRIDDSMPQLRRRGRVSALANVVRTGIPQRDDPTRFEVWKNGDFWFQSVFLPLGDRRVAVIFEDVTARATLEEAHECPSRLLEAVEQAVIATDVNGCITYWNRVAQSLDGWSASGLVAALAWHTDRYAAETGIEVDFRHGVTERLDNEIEIAAFRIIQEAMTNAARHAHPAQVRVRAWLAAGRLLAEIEDDGSGFALSSVSELQTAGLTGSGITVNSQLQ